MNQEVRELLRLQRVGAHSHIRGLGLEEENLLPKPKCDDGMIGQEKARRAAGLVVKMIQSGKLAGRLVLLAGQPGTGKTAIAMGVAKSLCEDCPFVHLTASEIFSLNLSKTECLTQAFRKAVGVKMVHETTVVEGEVLELEVDRATATSNGEKSARLTLATEDMESVFELGVKLIAAVEKENITAGDVIQIDLGSGGSVKKMGRSLRRSTDYDVLPGDLELVPRPTGELKKRRSVPITVSLHDMDVISSRSQGFLALFAGDTGEIPSEVRAQVDENVLSAQAEGKYTIIPGVLFIDEVHVLDIECFSFLNRALELSTCPVVLFATNKGLAKIRGSDFISPHGLPLDFLDRVLIIPTLAYDENEISEIIEQRLIEEEVDVSSEGKILLREIALETSLRYALQLVSLAAINAKRRKAALTDTEDIQRVFKIFLDVKRSTQYLEAFQEQFMFHTTAV